MYPRLCIVQRYFVALLAQSTLQSRSSALLIRVEPLQINFGAKLCMYLYELRLGNYGVYNIELRIILQLQCGLWIACVNNSYAGWSIWEDKLYLMLLLCTDSKTVKHAGSNFQILSLSTLFWLYALSSQRVWRHIEIIAQHWKIVWKLLPVCRQ